MDRPTIIIMTGRPAAGKSTLAKWLSRELEFPVVSKDSMMEEPFDRLGWKDRQWAQELGKASVDIMFYFAKAQLEVGGSIILDNTFNPVVSVPRFRSLKEQYQAESIQIICAAGNNVLFERFKNRFKAGNRHPGYGDETVLQTLRDFLNSDYSAFLDICGAAIKVDTTDFTKVNYQEILKQVGECLQVG